MSRSDGPSRGATILIVGDDNVTATDLQNGLIGAGHVVLRVESADQALVMLQSMQPDLILMSLMLPDTDGLILCSTLKARFQAPIIVLSAHANEVDRVLAMELGAIDCWTLPVDRDALLVQVKALVQSAFPGVFD